MQVPIVIPILVLIVSIYLTIAPIIDKPQLEYLYTILFLILGMLLYLPFVKYKYTPSCMSEYFFSFFINWKVVHMTHKCGQKNNFWFCCILFSKSLRIRKPLRVALRKALRLNWFRILLNYRYNLFYFRAIDDACANPVWSNTNRYSDSWNRNTIITVTKKKKNKKIKKITI